MNQAWICPRCERVNAPHVDSCGCSPVSDAKQPAVEGPTKLPAWEFAKEEIEKLKEAFKRKPAPPPIDWPYPSQPNWITWKPEPCAFDGLPPGVYGMVCCCPKCSPRYSTGTVSISPTITFTGGTVSSIR